MRKRTRGRASFDRPRVGRGGGSEAAAGVALQQAQAGLRPRELLMKVVRGEAVDGDVPTLAQRLAAARQVLPYDAPRLSPQPAAGDEGRELTVRVIRFAEHAEPFETPC